MKKFGLCIGLAIVLASIWMGGCGNDSAQPSPSPTEPTPSPTGPAQFSRHPAMDAAVHLAGKSIELGTSLGSGTRTASLKAKIEVEITGESVDVPFLNSGGQSFGGIVIGGRVSGNFETAVNRYAGSGAPQLPFTIPTDIAAYLKPEPGIESDDALIRQKADEIAFAKANTWLVASAIGEWVHGNIAPDPQASVGAGDALSSGKGDSTAQNLLAIALCRAVGIPARLVGGIAYSEGRFAQHYWMECYMGDGGWVPMDPALGQYGWVDATHIRLFRNGEIAALKSVEVLSYTTMPEPSQEKQSLSLTLGWLRRFSFVESGTEVLRNQSQVTDVRQENGTTVYTVRSELHLKPVHACKATDAIAVVEIDEGGNPVSYRTERLEIGSG